MERSSRWTFVLCLFAGLVALLVLVTSASSAHVRSVTVTNTNDSGPDSLRQAIADAGPGATIQFDLAYPATITLTSGQLRISSKDVTIAGPGSDLLTISGNHAHRVFRVWAPPPHDIHVAISGLTIHDGYATGEFCNARASGGGMVVEEGILSLMLMDVAFRGNTTDCYGGGMAVDESNQLDEVVLTNVTFSGNSALRDGGGLFTEHSANLTNVAFHGNSARNGGGLYATWARMKLANVAFSGNSARVYGGGMRILSTSHIDIQNSILWGNRADASGDQIHNSRYDNNTNIAYSDIEGSGGSGKGWDSSLGFDGGHNLDADPQFVGPADPAAAPTAVGDLHLLCGSPAIDSGNNGLLPPEVTTDLDGIPRIAFGTIDLGPYEFQEGLHLSKIASEVLVMPGQHVTYTIKVYNATGMMTDALISDTLPAELALTGPVLLDPPEAGVVGTAPPILVSDLTIEPRQVVTVILPVTVQEGLAIGTIITNTVSFTSAQLMTPKVDSCTIGVPFPIYLPMAARQSRPR